MKPILYTMSTMQALALIALAYYGSWHEAWLALLCFVSGTMVGILLAILWSDLQGDLT